MKRVVVSLVVLAGCFLVWCAVDFFRPHVRDYSGKTREEFVAKAGRDFGLPQRARDIRFVASSVSLGGRARAVKFTAPLAKDHRTGGLSPYEEERVQTCSVFGCG